MYFYSEWLVFGLCVVCDWLQVAYSFSFWLGHRKRNFSLLPCSPLFSAASPRDQLQSQHCVTVSSCDRLAYFWKSVPTLSLLEKKSKLSLKINPFGRGGESFRRHSALGLHSADDVLGSVTGWESFALGLARITCPQALQKLLFCMEEAADWSAAWSCMDVVQSCLTFHTFLSCFCKPRNTTACLQGTETEVQNLAVRVERLFFFFFKSFILTLL